jgi:hypothetical protein
MKKTYKDKENGLCRNVTTSFLTGNTEGHHGSCTVIIAKRIAKKYGIDEPSPIVVEGTEKGILIRRIEL